MNRSVYPELFGIVGDQVPNFHDGSFLRGVGGYAAGLGQVQSEGINANSGDGSFVVGGHQGGKGGYNAGVGSATGVFKSTPVSYALGNKGGEDWGFGAWKIDFDFAGSFAAPETRPKNRAVRYLIRALPQSHLYTLTHIHFRC